MKAMKRLIMAIAMTAMTMCATAQNAIDDMVDKVSTVGQCTLTSAVERNPRNGKIQKTVKVLESSFMRGDIFQKAFRQSASTGDFSETVDGDKRVMTLTVVKPGQNRIYMLQTDGNPRLKSHVKVTIIVKMK